MLEPLLHLKGRLVALVGQFRVELGQPGLGLADGHPLLPDVEPLAVQGGIDLFVLNRGRNVDRAQDIGLTAMSMALDGVRVLDLSCGIAGPTATMLLSDRTLNESAGTVPKLTPVAPVKWEPVMVMTVPAAVVPEEVPPSESASTTATTTTPPSAAAQAQRGKPANGLPLGLRVSRRFGA